MSTDPNNKDRNPKEPVPKVVKVMFKKGEGMDPHTLEGDVIHLTWDGGIGREYHFFYPGKKGRMMVPFQKIFEQKGHWGGKNQFYLLKGNEPLKLKLKDKSTIHDEQPDLPLDGKFQLGLAIFDEDKSQYAEKNSPPPIKLGP